VSLLRRNIPRGVVNGVWQAARSGACPRRRHCPACNRPMAEVAVEGAPQPVLLDVCVLCQFVWFDRSEYEALPERPPETSQQATLPQAARERLAVLEVQALATSSHHPEGTDQAPDEGWKWIPAILGMPVEYDAEAYFRIPLVTWTLAGTITVVSLAAFMDLPGTIAQFGLIPSQAWRYGGLTLVTAFFLHGGIAHLLGNLYFFLVFGDNVEACLGRRRFLLLMVLSSLAGAVVHLIGEAGSSIPCVGASGGISGVIAFYALKFPRARLGFLLRLYWRMRWVCMPAYGMFFVWVLMQCVGSWAQLAGFSNVSSLAHLGGAGVGFLFWLATRKE
jgi:membrane associated rhomboid family serine protease